ncbi:LysR family transcriptional regulator [Paracoccus saliphilus]|uniref:LysR family transcriptional regulator n=1 Tax=Paracoccus saliphilus TaxID=405559 RepID=A0AA45W8K4_9RHOB|nr:LysR family transcriptional regulator [Paracoccus saliphilus]WCR02669.1 LysR family transcriptional regulator [Paracoccus saliphilus]SIT17410.1 transcriptional regulator, LysR family [Paracoccus saliphilus]
MRDTNRLVEIETLLSVIAEGSFSAAARMRGMTPSAVSKMMARLEERLGVTLLKRSTRKVQVTEEGARFARQGQAILEALDAAEHEASCGRVAGTVRIATSAAYANHILAPVLGGLLRSHPEIRVDLVIGDHVSDLYGQPIDLAVRAGPLEDSNLMARHLGRSEIVEVVAPSRGDDVPPSLRIGFSYARRDIAWRGGSSRLQVNDGATIAALVAAGTGTARVGRFTVARELASREVVICSPHAEQVFEDFHLLYVGRAKTLPRRVQAVLDYISEHGRVDQHRE